MFIARISLVVTDRDALRAFAGAEVAAARALPGCVDYRFCEDVTSPNRILLYEEWTDRDSFEAYKSSPLFAKAGAAIRPLLAEPPQSAYYDSTLVGP